ncbi:LOW QUALITY PROTEIN: SH3 and multiple ankyrin repeat domains protein 1, partial [Mergus octosetaceus]
VNGQNVVKVGHRQVVNMIRQGGNSLVLKVVMVTRHPEAPEGPPKAAPPQPRRLPAPAISLRSKSMTSELEEMVSPWKKRAEYEPASATEKKRTVYQMALNKLDEILAAAQQSISAGEGPGAPLPPLGKTRPKAFFGPEASFEPHRMGRGATTAPSCPPGPPHGLMLRQKSIGAAEDDKPFLAPPSGKFSRSLSVPGSDDIPPPPTTSPPEPPYSTPPAPMGATGRGPAGGGPWRLYNLQSRGGPAPAVGPLVKQTKVEEGGGGGAPGGGEKSSIAIPTIVVKAPSTSSSGRSSRGSSVEAEGAPPGSGGANESGVSPPSAGGPPPSSPGASGAPHPPPAAPQLDFTSQFGAALVGAARREREWPGEASRRRSALFLSTEEEEEGAGGGPGSVGAPRLRHSKSIDEGMFAADAFPPRGYRGGKGGAGSAFSSVPGHPAAAPMHAAAAAPMHAAAAGLHPGAAPLHGGAPGMHGAPSPVHGASSPMHGASSPMHGPSSPMHGASSPVHPGAAPMHGGAAASLRSGASLHAAPGCKGLAALQAATMPLQAGAMSLQAGLAPLQPGLAPLQGGVALPSGGGLAAVGAGGAAPGLASLQAGALALQPGLAPLQAGALALQPNLASLQALQAGTLPLPAGASKAAPLQAAPAPLQSGALQAAPRRPPSLGWRGGGAEARLELRVRFAEAGGLLALPPPAPSVDGDEELLLAEPLPPPLEFSNSFEAAESAALGDSTASSLTSYDSEVATLTQAGTEAVTDSGIEEVDSRSSSDHPPESAEPPPAFAALLEGPERPGAAAGGGPRGGGEAGYGAERSGVLGGTDFPTPPPLPIRPQAPHRPLPQLAAPQAPGGWGELDVRPPLRRAPSPATLPSERRGSPAPRPASLPLPSGPLYAGLLELRGGPGAFGELPPTRSLSPTRPPPPDKPFGAKPLAFWSKFDVADWLEYLNLGEHRDRFLHNEIDGSHLPSLTKEDYIDLGVTRVGHRMNIDRALKLFLER